MKISLKHSILSILALMIASFFLAGESMAQSFWQHESLGFYEEFSHVNIAASDSMDYVATGFLSGGEAARSTDGGETWDTILTTGISIEGIVHPSRNLIIIGGVSNAIGYIDRSTDGGRTWNATAIGSTDSGKQRNPIGTIAALDSDHIFLPVAGNHYLYSSDAGVSWQSTACPVAVHYNGLALSIDNPVAAYPAQNTFVVAEADTFFTSDYGYKIYRSTDLGATWSSGFQTTHEITKFAFISPNVGFASGFISDVGSFAATATIDKTTDGGLTWFNIYNHRFSSAAELLGIAFADSLNGIAVGRGGTLIRSNNGGNTWIQDSTDFSTGDLNDVHDISYPTLTHAVAVTGGGDALVFQPNGILSMPVITYPFYGPPYPPSTFNATWNPVPGAETYWIEVIDPNADTLVVRDSNITSTSYLLSNLSAGNQGGIEYELFLQARGHSSKGNIANRLFIIYGSPSSVKDFSGGPLWQYLAVQTYPDPAIGHFHVRLNGIYSNPDARLTAEMVDLLGRKVMDLTDIANKSSNGSYSDFDLDSHLLSDGVYSIRYSLGAYSSQGLVVVVH